MDYFNDIYSFLEKNMLIKIIRFIFINFSSLFIYKKIQEVSPKKNSGLFLELFYSLISSTISAYSNLLVEGIDIYCFFAMFITYQYIIYKHSFKINHKPKSMR